MVVTRLLSLDFSWRGGDTKIDEQLWEQNEEKTYIVLRDGDIRYGDIDLLEGSLPEISIADLMILSPETKKKTLEIKGAPWKVEIGPEDVSIGCCSFKKEKLKETLQEILNLSHKDRAKKYYFTLFTAICNPKQKVIHFYEGRDGLDIWIDNNFEHTVSWKAVEELVAVL